MVKHISRVDILGSKDSFQFNDERIAWQFSRLLEMFEINHVIHLEH